MKTYPSLLLLLVATWAFTACRPDKPARQTPPDDTALPVTTALVGTATTTESVYASGLLSSDAEARLSFKTGGIINRIYVHEGQAVRRGQVLASLNLTEINAQVQQARQGYEKAERDLNRVKNLYADTAATLEQLQNVTTAHAVARQSLTITQFNQDYSQLRAPADGTVLKKLMNEGELAGPGIPVVYIAATGSDNWVVRVGVADKDWAKLNIGDKAAVSLDAYPEDTFMGTVTELAQAADPLNKLYEIELRVAPQGKRFAPGLFAKAEIKPAGSRTYRTIPIEALVEANGKQAFVYVPAPDGRHVKKVPVRVAYLDNQQVMIASGLEGVEQVITGGASFLTEQSEVALVKQ